MTAETDLLPLPEATMKSYQTDSTMRTMTLHSYSESAMRDYARANVAHATAAKDAEIEALRAEVEAAKGRAAENLQRTAAAEARAERLAEALREKLRLWRIREDGDEPHTEFDAGYEQASDECANAIEALLREQEAGRG